MLFLKVHEVGLPSQTVFKSEHGKFVSFDDNSREFASAINRHREEMGVGTSEAVTYVNRTSKTVFLPLRGRQTRVNTGLEF